MGPGSLLENDKRSPGIFAGISPQAVVATGPACAGRLSPDFSVFY